jgi:hypothetical protein
MSHLDGFFSEMLASLQEAQARTERNLAAMSGNVLPLRPDEARESGIALARSSRDEARSLYVLMIEQGAEPLELTLAEGLVESFQRALDRLEAERV